MYDPTQTMDPPPPPPSAGASTMNARYVFLLGRLRTRQITMEEATELFSIQQSMIRSANASSAPSSGASLAPSNTASSPAPGPGTLGLSDDVVWLALLGMGAGAGLLAAMVKRSQEGPKTSRSTVGPAAGPPGSA